MSEKELIYIADPMCSWCWGFSSVIQQIADRLHVQGAATLRILPGGLRTEAASEMGQKAADEVMHHWQDVAKATGQAFNFESPLKADYVYNTAPACLAVSVMARHMPGMELPYLHALHQAFYVERRDLKQLEVLTDCAVSCGVVPGPFAEKLGSPDARTWASRDIDTVRQWGIQGFPAVLLLTGDQVSVLTIGYQAWGELQKPLDEWLGAA